MQNHTVSPRVKFAQACLFNFYLLQYLSLSLNIFCSNGYIVFCRIYCSLFNKLLIDSYLGRGFFGGVGGGSVAMMNKSMISGQL